MRNTQSSNTPSGELEIAYAQYGDITLQGLVNAADFHVLASNFGQIVTNGWEDGDFLYQGVVNALDFHLLSGNFGQTEIGEDASVPATVSADTITTAVPSVVSATPTVAPTATDLEPLTKRGRAAMGRKWPRC
jgi:hypothetical protein